MRLKIRIPKNNQLKLNKLKINISKIKECKIKNIINAVINSYNLDNYSNNKIINLIRFIKIIRNDFKNEIYNYKIKILLSLTFNYLSLIFLKYNTDISVKDEKIKLFKKYCMIEFLKIQNIYFKSNESKTENVNLNELGDIINQLDQINLI